MQDVLQKIIWNGIVLRNHEFPLYSIFFYVKITLSIAAQIVS